MSRDLARPEAEALIHHLDEAKIHLIRAKELAREAHPTYGRALEEVEVMVSEELDAWEESYANRFP